VARVLGSSTAMSETAAPQSSASVPEIDREALRARMDRGDDFKLVMAGRPWAFRAKHIPGSLNFKDDAAMFAGLSKNDDIVVYCSNTDCHASVALIKKLLEHGYQNLAHYAGGLIDWEGAGLTLDGDWSASPPSTP
jgi:rhodanese-related sulfurtransferase